MNQYSHQNSKTLNERVKELLILAGFTLAAAIVSVIVIDVIATGVVMFAVKKKAAFNLAIKYSTLGGLLFAIGFALARRVFWLRKDGLAPVQIMRHLLRRLGHHLAVFFSFLAISVVLIFLLYVLLGKNYYLLYKITNG